MNVVEATQWSQLQKVIGMIKDIMTKASLEEMELMSTEVTGCIRNWADFDLKSQDPCDNKALPNLVRAIGEKEFPMQEQVAVLTPFGIEYLFEHGGLTKDGDRAWKNGFISNVMGGKVQIVDKGHTCKVGEVVFKLTPPKQKPLGDAEAPLDIGDYANGISYTADIATRWQREGGKNLPYPLVGMLVAWFTTLDSFENLTWNDYLDYGVQPMITAVVYLACEWAGRNCKNLKSRKKGKADGVDNLDILSLLTSFHDGNDKGFKVNSWLHKWRSFPYKYKYVTASDVGYEIPLGKGIQEWSTQTLSDTLRGLETVQETPMPWVYTAKGVAVQSSALTTMCFLRPFICYVAGVRTSGTSNLSGS
jgi:hypothetical protein